GSPRASRLAGISGRVMGMYDKEAVRSASPIDHVVAELTGQALKRRGQELIGICPFHHDTSPSLNVNPEKGTFLCRSCQAGGDVFAFVEKQHACTFPEALRFLGERAGVSTSTQMTPTASAPSLSRIHLDEIEREHLYCNDLLRKILLRQRVEG